MSFLRRLLWGATAGVGAAGAIDFWRQDERAFRTVFMPVVHRLLDGEDAHRLGVWAAKHKLFPRSTHRPAESMRVSLWDLHFDNPVGLAAGFDKNGEAVEGLARWGFGFVEIGSVTPLPQPGNPKPRVFRLPEDQAVINRYGFNSEGHEAVAKRLTQYRADESRTPCILGINLGKNKLSESAVDDYTQGVTKFAHMADYLVVNVSSPNTPGLRNLQARKELDELIVGVLSARDEACKGARKTPLLLKIAPDLTKQDKEDIASVVTSRHVDGLIVSNTTISRPETLKGASREEMGGLSGRPVRDLSTEVIGDMYKLTKGQVPIIGVGGIANGRDAYAKLRAGASLVQFYSAVTYHGPPLVKRIQRELEELIVKDGLTSVSEAVGAAHRK
mmetsp:Transcript_20957/g.53080  ORF Transcript_20957/g.53080 Transcript_20957/m.53080 type:complete len:388 (-) Transcript_20957:230-1393(-)